VSSSPRLMPGCSHGICGLGSLPQGEVPASFLSDCDHATLERWIFARFSTELSILFPGEDCCVAWRHNLMNRNPV
jgi:hypothetical protein